MPSPKTRKKPVSLADDTLLRVNGWTVYKRPRRGEAWRKKGAQIVLQSEALRLVKNGK